MLKRQNPKVSGWTRVKMNSKFLSGTIAGTGAAVLLFVFFAPITILSIDGFDGTLETNTPISFSAQQIGCGISCDEFAIEIIKEDGSQNWSYRDSLDGKLFEEYPKMLFQKNTEPSRPFVANYPGEYTVKVSSDDYFIEKKFTVHLLEGMVQYGAVDYYQYVQIQEFLQSCMQAENLTEEQCDSKVRERISYSTQRQFEKPYFTVNLKDICIHLDLICPAHHPFAGIEKDGHIVVRYSHEWEEDQYYEFVIENNSIKSVRYSGDILKEQT